MPERRLLGQCPERPDPLGPASEQGYRLHPNAAGAALRNALAFPFTGEIQGVARLLPELPIYMPTARTAFLRCGAIGALDGITKVAGSIPWTCLFLLTGLTPIA